MRFLASAPDGEVLVHLGSQQGGGDWVEQEVVGAPGKVALDILGSIARAENDNRHVEQLFVALHTFEDGVMAGSISTRVEQHKVWFVLVRRVQNVGLMCFINDRIVVRAEAVGQSSAANLIAAHD